MLRAQARDKAAFEKNLQRALHHHSIHAAHAFYVWRLFFERDEGGLTFAERWERAGFSDLKNDERVLLRAKMQTRIAVVEIHRIIDHEQVEAVDLLSPGSAPILLRDRSLASVAVRFVSGVTWIYRLPHYWRLSGTAVLIPEMAQFEPAEIVTETVRHLGGPATVSEMPLWLAENLVRFDDALTAAARARRMQMFAGLDAQFGKAIHLASSRVIAPSKDVPPDQTDAEVRASDDRAFIDNVIPALDGQTPREAARNPALRPKLIRLLKQRVRWTDEDNLRTGHSQDVNWLLRELGTNEILFEPPPWRPPRAAADPDVGEEDSILEDDLRETELAHRPPAPPLPAEPLTHEEACDRLQASLDLFDTTEQAMDELDASGSTILADADELTAGLLDDKASAILITFLLQAWFAIVPRGCRAPRITFDALADAFDRERDKFLRAVNANSADKVVQFLEDSPQPNLARVLAFAVMNPGKRPKELRVKLEIQPVIVAFLKAVVEELDREGVGADY